MNTNRKVAPQAFTAVKNNKTAEVIKLGKRGTLVIPVTLRKLFDLVEGGLIIAEDHGDGILLKPAVAVASENYSLERKAEFLLSNAIDEKDYEEAKKAVRELGLDPEKIHHYKPKTDAE